MATELNLSGFSELTIPNLEEQLEEALKPQASLAQGVYLAVITNVDIHHGAIKPGNQWPSIGFMVEMNINASTRKDDEDNELNWVSADRMVPVRQYVWLGYNTDKGISYRTKNNPDNTTMPRGAASFLRAVGSGPKFDPAEHAGVVVVVSVRHSTYTSDNGNEYINLDCNIYPHRVNDEILRFDVEPKSEDSTESNPFS